MAEGDKIRAKRGKKAESQGVGGMANGAKSHCKKGEEWVWRLVRRSWGEEEEEEEEEEERERRRRGSES
jgi:hypothetical protein